MSQTLSRKALASSFFDQVHPLISRLVSTTITPATSAITTTASRTPTLFVSNNTNTLRNNNQPGGMSPQQVLFKLNKNLHPLIRRHHNKTRLQESVSHHTTNNDNSNFHSPIVFRPSIFDQSDYPRSLGQIGNLIGFTKRGPTNTRLSQFHVRNPKERWGHTSSLQPQTAQPISSCSSLQNGHVVGSITNDSSKRLPSLNRFVRCTMSPYQRKKTCSTFVVALFRLNPSAQRSQTRQLIRCHQVCRLFPINTLLNKSIFLHLSNILLHTSFL